MKRAILFLLILASLSSFGQEYQFCSASSGVRYRKNGDWLWGNCPKMDSSIHFEDSFQMNRNDTVVIIANDMKNIYTACKKSIITVKDIIKECKLDISKGFEQEIKDNGKDIRNPHVDKVIIGGIVLSSSQNNVELECAKQLCFFARLDEEGKRTVVDSSFILEKKYISPKEFSFILKNQSIDNCYMTLFRISDNVVNVVFDNELFSDDGMAGVVFYVPDHSLMELSSFTFVDNEETSYILVASTRKINHKMVCEYMLDLATESETSWSSLFHFGICIENKSINGFDQ